MRILLAPMEGVVDHHVRTLLTDIGGIDGCVTEFVRVNDQLLPPKVFHRLAPEILSNAQTPAGIPVKVQLLGSNPTSMAKNALEAIKAGATAIDLNFGCPAKTVNKSEGGACLLKTPSRVHDIVKAVRDAVPAHIAVSAKIRLGYEDRSTYLENAKGVADAGATELVVHARSKADGYKPPAYWSYLAEIKKVIDIPLVANGEIWSVDDYFRCREISTCDDVMIGRGLLACPDLARQIKAQLQNEAYKPLTWQVITEMLYSYYLATFPTYEEKHCGNRVKQWLMYLRLQYPEADICFEEIKRKKTPAEIEQTLLNTIDKASQ